MYVQFTGQTESVLADFITVHTVLYVLISYRLIHKKTTGLTKSACMMY
jgi:hypothetical protein